MGHCGRAKAGACGRRLEPRKDRRRPRLISPASASSNASLTYRLIAVLADPTKQVEVSVRQRKVKRAPPELRP